MFIQRIEDIPCQNTAGHIMEDSVDNTELILLNSAPTFLSFVGTFSTLNWLLYTVVKREGPA